MMLKISILFMISLLIPVLLIVMCTLIAKKSNMDREKLSPYECGFDPYKSARMPFSIQFFMIAILFLIFDVEIVIILPASITLKYGMLSNWIITSSFFIIILLLGLHHEWYNGILEWTK
uniref:NADH-ubiquinone oxidoreductase chain 3 n=1 Tax=Alloeorhynchus bakeri TaxID=796621 RepID=G9B4I9_9HEMI|nr:NADH dehydrogenase subunit 3 [Alloeorhynchus bakeri]ADI75225.1 NADH dehydrogenase subunit 3 [Alloeorhynchus bakeri]